MILLLVNMILHNAQNNQTNSKWCYVILQVDMTVIYLLNTSSIVS